MTAQPPLIWRGFTREALDRAYSPSSMTDGIEPFLRRYAETGARVRAGFAPARLLTRAYGPAASQTLDLFLPEGEPAPLLLFIHGGYWQALGKADGVFPAADICRQGIAYASLDYTLAPSATMDAIVDECRSAILWLARERVRLGLADTGVVLAGHSAGAHLAAMMLTTDWAAMGHRAPPVRGAILISGIYDLEPIRLSYVNEAIGMDMAAAMRNSPVRLIPTFDVPIVITAAERDTDEFRRQARALAAAWAPHGRDLALFEHAGRNHFDCLFDWHDPDSRLSVETRRLCRPERG